ncbi:FIST C-terminal domain-containing protein [Rhodobacteraceae bacterium]|nr:FIST C-terminal domain-containing protein [Paracoccaceae bacterium]
MAHDSALMPSSVDVSRIVRTADMDCDASGDMNKLASELGTGPFALIILFIAPCADFDRVIQGCAAYFPDTPVIGCSTAGEICKTGYEDRKLVAVALPQSHFIAKTHIITDLNTHDLSTIAQDMVRTRAALAEIKPNWDYEFNYILIDGLSRSEDQLVSALSVGLGPVPLFGGSSADGVDFQRTRILHDGKIYQNAAVLAQIRTRCPIKVFKTDHLIPSDQRMVVTKADPANRTVSEINAAPAAREYARLLGKDPEQLTPFTFAAHPVVVRVGGQHHVRAIQRVAENGDLIFFSAIDEGLVLTLADPMDMEDHLARELDALSATTKPDMILACDCILRKLEAQEKQKTRALSELLSKRNVVGFSTYGEQYNSMHVNQTLTGVAIYPPKDDAC